MFPAGYKWTAHAQLQLLHSGRKPIWKCLQLPKKWAHSLAHTHTDKATVNTACQHVNVISNVVSCCLWELTWLQKQEEAFSMLAWAWIVIWSKKNNCVCTCALCLSQKEVFISNVLFYNCTSINVFVFPYLIFIVMHAFHPAKNVWHILW